MTFQSHQVKGKGRGKPMGFPTINLKIPAGFKLKDGIYAAKVSIDRKTFLGALHFGPVPTFKEKDKSLEVFLIDITNNDLKNKGLENLYGRTIKVKIIKFLRPVKKFRLVGSLVKQIDDDIRNIKEIEI